MSSILCRLCATTDENGIVVVGEERLRKVLPNRVQQFLGIDIHNGLNKCLTICRHCHNLVDIIDEFFYKVQAAQQIWTAINFEVDDTKEHGNKVVVFSPKPKRREAKLVPFLVRSLDSSRFRGLVWENRNVGLFRLPWPRQGTNRWRPEDSQLFKEWAVLKGRYSEKEDFVLWKTCIRTSLHKLPNIREVRELHNFSANPPYKVYRITDFPDAFLASSKLINMDHNYFRSDVEDTDEKKDDAEGVRMRVDAATETGSPVTFAYYEAVDENSELLDEKPMTVELRNMDESDLNLTDTVWIVAQEETVDEAIPSAQKGITRVITSTSSGSESTQEAITKWINEMKWSNAQSQSLPAKRVKVLEATADLSLDKGESSTDKGNQSPVRRDSSPTGSEISLHMSTSDEDEVELISNIESSTRKYGEPDSEMKCIYCNTYFTSLKSLRVHINLHDEEISKKAAAAETVSTEEESKHYSDQEDTSLSDGSPSWKFKRDSEATPERVPGRRGRKPKRGRFRGASMLRTYTLKPVASTSQRKPVYIPQRGRKKLRPSTSTMGGIGRKRECGECGKFFDNVCELVKHRQSCSSEHKLRRSTHMKSKGSQSLRVGNSSTSTVTGNSPVRKKSIILHRCNICDKNFKDLTGLEEHLNSHFNIMAYHCNICRKRFTTAKDLQEHLQQMHTKS